MSVINQQYKHILEYLLLGVILYFSIFHLAESKPIQLWDESRLTTNAVEMHQNGNYLVPHFENQPDMWNSKPPLMVICQSISISLFGPTELAIRFPALLSGLLTVLLLFGFSKYYLKNNILAWASILILLSSTGFNGVHRLQTGDYDSMLTLWMTAYCILYFLFIEKKKLQYWYGFVLCLILASLTKGIAGLLMLPGIVIFTLYRKKVLDLIKNPHFYVGILIWAFFVLGYYFLREQYNPGYIEQVWHNELGGRFLITNEGHNDGTFAYLQYLFPYFRYWVFLLPFAIIAIFLKKDHTERPFLLYSIALSITFLFVLSSSQTKISWYSMPNYPWYSIQVGFLLFLAYQALSNKIEKNSNLKFGLVIFWIVLCIPLVLKMEEKINYQPNQQLLNENGIEMYLRDSNVTLPKDRPVHIVVRDYFPQVNLYIYQLSQKGVDIKLSEFSDINVGDDVIFSDQSVKAHVDSTYHYKQIDHRAVTYHLQILKNK